MTDRLTRSEKEPSPCTKKKEYNPLPKGYWEGMNMRDETDECTHRPVGRGLAEGFTMLNDDFDGGTDND